MLADLPFFKMNGLGNKIVVLDLRMRSFDLTSDDARIIGRFEPTSFEQLMVLYDPVSEGSDASMRIYNADGSEAGACGNGTRCVGWVILRDTDRTTALIETPAGQLSCMRDDAVTFTVDMGKPRFMWDSIPLAFPVPDTAALPLQRDVPGLPSLKDPTGLSMGNPHAVFFVESAAAYDLASIGPSLECDSLFPDRANISLAQVVDRNHLLLRVWERGAGETRACGSGACAAAAAAIRRNLVERTVTVHLPGGDLMITWRNDGHVLMTGPVELEASGYLPLSFVKNATSQ